MTASQTAAAASGSSTRTASLLHHDRDFGVIARVTGQPLRWYGSG